MNYQARPRNEKAFTIEERKELLSYHNKGLNYKEVAALMRIDPTRLKKKAVTMGVSLKSK